MSLITSSHSLPLRRLRTVVAIAALSLGFLTPAIAQESETLSSSNVAGISNPEGNQI